MPFPTTPLPQGVPSNPLSSSVGAEVGELVLALVGDTVGVATGALVGAKVLMVVGPMVGSGVVVSWSPPEQTGDSSEQDLPATHWLQAEPYASAYFRTRFWEIRVKPKFLPRTLWISGEDWTRCFFLRSRIFGNQQMVTIRKDRRHANPSYRPHTNPTH